MKNITSVLTLAALLGATACASAPISQEASVARLEQEQRSSPNSASVNRSLGIAYYKANRFPEARRALETSSRIDPRDGATSLYLGLTAEAQGDLPAAKQAYGSYITYGRTSRVRGQLQNRLAALARKEITADAKASVAQESALSSVAGSPRTIAVLPLRFSGADTSLKPLERGFADLLITDLARSSQLTIVERSRMQALMDEMALQKSGSTDAATNVRAGRLLRAGRVVQGTLLQVNTSQLRVDAAVVDVPTTQVRGTATGADLLDQVFNLEKKIALDLFTQLGVNLTVAERNAVEQRPTRNLAAFLAYSRGLKAEDEGRYDDASRFYGEAVRLDPGFNAAQQKSTEAKAVTAGVVVTAQSVETVMKGTSEGAVVAAAAQGTSTGSGASGSGLGTTVQTAAGSLNPSPSGAAAGAGPSGGIAGSIPGSKDPVSSGTGSDNPTGSAKVTIIITRPKP